MENSFDRPSLHLAGIEPLLFASLACWEEDGPAWGVPHLLHVKVPHMQQARVKWLSSTVAACCSTGHLQVLEVHYEGME